MLLMLLLLPEPPPSAMWFLFLLELESATLHPLVTTRGSIGNAVFWLPVVTEAEEEDTWVVVGAAKLLLAACVLLPLPLLRALRFAAEVVALGRPRG